MYAVTGASGRLGRLVIDALLAAVDPGRIVALARNPSTSTPEVGRSRVDVRAFDYDEPGMLCRALGGVERLLLISGDEIGRREEQHRAVIDAAKAAGVGFLAYTSVLHADDNPIGLAADHRATEAAVKASGLSYALLRHGWYSENFTASAAMDIARGSVVGSAGGGRLSTATRADYAAADAAVLLDAGVEGRTFELAGDEAFTMAEYAAVLAEVGGKPVRYVDMPETDYRDALQKAGMPAGIAALLSESSAKSARDVMFDDGRALSRLTGRPTVSIRAAVQDALDLNFER